MDFGHRDNDENEGGRNDSNGCHCEDRFPRTDEYFAAMPIGVQIFVNSCIVFYVLILALFVAQVHSIQRYVSGHARRSIMLKIVAVFPVTGFCAISAITLPATATLIKLIIPAYLMEMLINFVHLIYNLYGGLSKMAETSEAAQINIKTNVGPLRCFKCLPQFKPTRHNLRILAAFVYQAGGFDFVLTLAEFYGFAYGIDIEDQYPVLKVIKILSTMLGMFACYTLATLTYQLIKQKYRLPQMFRCIQLLLLLLNIQEAVFTVLGANGVFNDHIIMLDEELKGFIMNDMILVVELLILSIIVCVYFRPSNCALFDRYGKGVVTTRKQNNKDVEPKRKQSSAVRSVKNWLRRRPQMDPTTTTTIAENGSAQIDKTSNSKFVSEVDAMELDKY